MIPLEDFFRKPDKAMLRISPGGGYLAYLEPYERRLNVVVRNLDTGETHRVTHATERDIAGYTWASDERLIYVQDTGGDENYRLYAVGRDGSNPLRSTSRPSRASSATSSTSSRTTTTRSCSR